MLVIEILGVITGLLCVWLLTRQNIWTWPLGIANNLCYIVVFFASKLYADMSLQFFFIAIAIYGWWNWRRGGRSGGELPVRQIGGVHAFVLVALTCGLTLAISTALQRYTDSNVPYWDAFTTSLSLCALYMQSRKLIEHWYVWITADVFYIGLYIYQDLLPTMFLYAVFMALCVLGLVEWRKSLAQPPPRPLEPAILP
jgi:nicotinamide mononucleotide transporter